ncbi:hypothetical protein SLEP1_g45768 [Rubroshorea leprosula]|uniref:Uncharacterized protein n=1 Tax=Rubroshorea leprosula TaxID=152421 RepID=A0AAV5LLM5_9ROSI|nr:hypothetical protein SLEP1_g45768 [Rubroshorea leprosula]
MIRVLESLIWLIRVFGSFCFNNGFIVVYKVDAGILCEPCNGRGWLVCDYCKGKKTNIKAENNRIYRRCPSCRAIGYVLCSSCKVFKCVTFPDYSDGEELSF